MEKPRNPHVVRTWTVGRTRTPVHPVFTTPKPLFAPDKHKQPNASSGENRGTPPREGPRH